jgi:hypothetical protein
MLDREDGHLLDFVSFSDDYEGTGFTARGLNTYVEAVLVAATGTRI